MRYVPVGALLATLALAGCADPKAATLADSATASSIEPSELAVLRHLMDEAHISNQEIHVYDAIERFPLPRTSMYGMELFGLTSQATPSRFVDDDAIAISGSRIVAIRLTHAPSANLADLVRLTSLRAIDLHADELRALPDLTPLTHLEFLDVSANQLSSLRGIERLQELRVLYAAGNAITGFEPVPTSPLLENINLAWNSIPQIQGFEGVPNLKALSLEGNPIERIQGLDHSLDLRYLNLSFCRISEIEGVGQLQALEHLDLTHNRISSLHGIENMPKLVYLSLGENPYPLGDPKAESDLKRLGFLKFFYIL